MAEKKNRKSRRAIASTRRKYVEALGLESEENPVVAFDGMDGEEYSFLHPMYMDEEQQKAVDEAETQRGKVEALLGPEQYKQFMSHPAHRAGDVILLFGEVGREMQDVMGDGQTPTQSSTS